MKILGKNYRYLLLVPSLILSQMAHSTPLRVGVEAIPFLPYSEIQADSYQGVFRDILDLFAKTEGLQFEYVPLPIKRLYSEFYNNTINIKIPANAYWQADTKAKLKTKIHYSEPLVSFTDGLMVHKSNKHVPIESIKSIGSISGFTTWEYLGHIEKGLITKQENPSLLGLLKQGLMRRIDGIYTNIAVAEYYLKNTLKKPGELVFAKQLPHTESHFHFATIKNPELIKKFAKFAVTHKADIQKIKAKWQVK